MIQSSDEAAILPLNEIDRSDPFAVIKKITPGTTRKTLAAMYSGSFESAYTESPKKDGKVTYAKTHKSKVDQAIILKVSKETKLQ